MSKTQNSQPQYEVSATESVEAFIMVLNPKERAKAIRTIELLADFGPTLREPHCKSIGGKLLELRFEVMRKCFRIFYFRKSNGEFILIHAYRKQKNAAPKDEVSKAQRRMRELTQ